MISYFFNKGEDKEVLYIPCNVVVVGDNNRFDVNYCPGNIQAYDWIWEQDKRLLIGPLDDCVIDVVNIDPKLLDDFQDNCFDCNHLLAHMTAISMFQLTKNEVLKYRRRKCQ